MSSEDLHVTVSGLPAGKLLTCIIPLRVNPERGDAFERVTYFQLDTRLPKEVGFIVVDDGSPAQAGGQLESLCASLGLGYIRIESSASPFAVGRCRNVGAMHASSQYVLMQDVDLMPYPGFYQSLLDEIEVQGLDLDAKKFLMVPCVYLTREGTEHFWTTRSDLRARKFIHHAWEGEKSLVGKVSTGTSVNLYNRLWFLSRGGNCEEFEGWGYEDYEFNTRAILHLNQFPTPPEWLLQKYNFTSVLEYRNWRAVYRLFGDLLFYKGTAFFHAWHPVAAGGDYMGRRRRNWRLFKQKMKIFFEEGLEPEPLPDLTKGRTLLVSRNAFTYSREIRPLLGDVTFAGEDLPRDESETASYLRKNRISTVVFHNPYRDEKTLAFYRAVRAAGMRYVVCERGALPGSCFFDDSGFLVDGTAYVRVRWDSPLSQIAEQRTASYLSALREGVDSLEEQSGRIGREATRRRLGLTEIEKVLVVPLQRPGDTVTRFFTGEFGGYEVFQTSLRSLSSKMPNGWRMVVKRHPLEETDIELDDHAIRANEVNIRDLLDVADAVLTYNSGVGVMAMAWGLPTMVAGNAFYAHEGLNVRVRSVAEILDVIRSPIPPSPELVKRFYWHLIERVYSFGEFETRAVKTLDGGRMTATLGIRFRELRWPGETAVYFSDNRDPVVSYDSLLFDRYRSRRAGLEGPRTRGEQGWIADRGSGSQSRREVLRRKWVKFRRSPRRFLMDSKSGLLRLLGRLVLRGRP